MKERIKVEIMKNNLEEEIRDWLENGNLPKHDNYNDGDIRETARHFAEWTKQKEEDIRKSALRELSWDIHTMICKGKDIKDIHKFIINVNYQNTI